MSTRKLVRLFRHGLEAEHVVVLAEIPHRGHIKFELQHAGCPRVQKLTLAGSPAIFEASLARALREVRHFRGRA